MLAYGNIQQGRGSGRPPRSSRTSSAGGSRGDDLLGFQMAFDVTGDPAFPEQAAFEVARELGVPVTTHVGVWGATNDDGIRLMHEAGFMTRDDLRARRDADGGLLPAHRRHRRVGVAGDRERAERRAGLPAQLGAAQDGIPVSLSMDTSVWWSGDLFSAMRTTLGADRSREHLEAHATGDTVTNHALRAEQVVDWATLGGARRWAAIDLGSVEVGKKADLVLLKNEQSPAVVPGAQPLRPRRVPGPARRRAHRAGQRARGEAGGAGWSARTSPATAARSRRRWSYLRSTMGDEAWQQGMHPDVPESRAGGEPVPVQRLRRGDARAVTLPTIRPSTAA